MSVHDERFAEIERRYHDAVNHYYSDMAAAQDNEQAISIDENYYGAEKAYNTALEKMLIGQNEIIQDTFDKLKAANSHVEQLREEAAVIAEILKVVTKATSLATRLVLIAA